MPKEYMGETEFKSYQNFINEKFWNIDDDVELNETYRRVTADYLQQFYNTMTWKYPTKVNELYWTYVSKMLVDNIKSGKGVTAVEDMKDENGEICFEKGISYLDIGEKYYADQMEIHVNVYDMFGKLKWVDLRKLRVNI